MVSQANSLDNCFAEGLIGNRKIECIFYLAKGFPMSLSVFQNVSLDDSHITIINFLGLPRSRCGGVTILLQYDYVIAMAELYKVHSARSRVLSLIMSVFTSTQSVLNSSDQRSR